METKITIEGKEYTVDIAKAKELGVLKEDTTIKDFKVGDVFLRPCGSKLIIVENGYAFFSKEQRYNIAGLYGLELYSDIGSQGLNKTEMLAWLNKTEMLAWLNKSCNGNHTKFIKNINDDIQKLLESL
jgi:hypothetical protein